MIGSTKLNAKTPTTGKSTRRISSVAYADDEMQSDENTARAVGMPRRSCSSSCVWRGGPRSRFLIRYDRVSGSSTSGAGGSGRGTSRGTRARRRPGLRFEIEIRFERLGHTRQETGPGVKNASSV